MSSSAAAPVPNSKSLARLALAAKECRACELYRDATQVVFGQGSRGARLVLVGEQPGDVEDHKGEPFIGPAGALLDRALQAAGLDRQAVYLTNAVKHFRWKPATRGKRRIHQTPNLGQVRACRPWLEAELGAVRPAVVVALGAVAAWALFGPEFRLSEHRGEPLDWPDGAAVATIHPSAVLRAGEQRAEFFDGLVADLKLSSSLAAPRSGDGEQ